MDFAEKARVHSSKLAEQTEGVVKRFVEQGHDARADTRELAGT